MKIQMTLLALPIALLVGCVGSTAVRYDSHPHYEYSDVYYRTGPPPHAPAHGYRHHYHNHDMIYDSGIRAYIIVGMPDYYYDNGFYFRYSNIGWQFSGSLNDGWKVTDERRVPRTLWNTRSKKQHYDNDQRSKSYNYKSDKEQPRNGHQDNRSNSGKDRSRNDYQDDRGNSDKARSKNDYQDNRNNSDKARSRNDYQDDRSNLDKARSRNDYQDDRGNSDKARSRNDYQDNRGNSDKTQSRNGHRDNSGNAEEKQSRNDQKSNSRESDRYGEGYKDRNDHGYR
jgi:hypothetical protein